MNEAMQVKSLWAQAKTMGLTGDRRYAFVLSKMGKDPRTDFSWVKRHLRRARDTAQEPR
jgi:hypothetical protein